MLRVAICVYCTFVCVAAIAAPPAAIDDYVARAMQRFEIPGMAVTVVEAGETTLARGYGVRRLGEPTKVDPRTLFPIGSNTKAFTAAALAILIDEGKLGWDDKVVDRLQGFRMYDPYATHEMTIRDLLVHRSGLGLGAGDLLFFPPTDLTRKELIERLRYIKPATSFRSAYAYDNVLYIVAGQVVEEVSGLTWETFVQQRILEPLGMSDSVSSRAAVRTDNRGWPHGRLDGPMRGMGKVVAYPGVSTRENSAPAGAIQSSAADMAHWLRVQLDQGAIGRSGKRLFSEAVAREMWMPHTVIPSEPAPAPLELTSANFETYALGWVVRDYRGHKILTHTGGVEGGLSVTALVPEKRVGIAVMINSEDGAARRAVFYRLLDHYLGLASPDWIDAYAVALEQQLSKALQTLEQQVAEEGSDAGPSLASKDYAGVYRDAWYGAVTITAGAQGDLQIRFDRSPGMSGALEHVRYDTFRTRFTDRRIEDAYATFALKPDGSIEQMKMQAISPLADFSFDYHDLLFTPMR